MGYSIQQVSVKTGLTPYVLRYYEKEGLLQRIHRSKSGIRHYSDEDLERLELICCLKKTGMPIKQIRLFMDLSAQGDATLKRRCELLTEHKRSVEAQILEMNRHLVTVSHKIECFTSQYDQYAQAQR
jgi:DNA-binding transcriptional MerR regulator